MSLRPRVREPTIKTRIPKLRAWGLSLNGKRVRFLGFVEATNQEAAESTGVDELGLSHKQRKRLVVQELPGKVRAAAVSALNLNESSAASLHCRGGVEPESPSPCDLDKGELRQLPEPIHQCPEPVPLRTVANSLQGARLALFQINHPS